MDQILHRFGGGSNSEAATTARALERSIYLSIVFACLGLTIDASVVKWIQLELRKGCSGRNGGVRWKSALRSY